MTGSGAATFVGPSPETPVGMTAASNAQLQHAANARLAFDIPLDAGARGQATHFAASRMHAMRLRTVRRGYPPKDVLGTDSRTNVSMCMIGTDNLCFCTYLQYVHIL